MSAKESWVDRIYNKLTAPKTIKICGYSAMVFFFGAIGLGVIIAAVFGPEGYNIIDNWISDLGNHNITPAPFLLDFAVISAGVLLFPLLLYLEKYLAPIPRVPEDLPAPPRMVYRLMSLGFFFNCLGSLGMIGVGVFSEDRDIADLHFIFSVLLFGSFAIGAIFLGLRFSFIKQDLIPKPYNFLVGLYGICVPLPVGIIAAFNVFGETGIAKLMEWIIFLVLIGLIVPIFVSSLRHAEKQLQMKK
jgi:hypothetical membrane protein